MKRLFFGTSEQMNNKHGVFDKGVFFCIAALIVVLPILFYPSLAVPFQFTKAMGFASFVLLGLIVFVAARLKQQTFSMPTQGAFFALLGIPFAYLLATFFGQNQTSLLGSRIEIDTFAFMFLGTILAFLVIQTINSKHLFLNTYIAFLISFALTGLYQSIRFLIGGDVLSFGVFGSAGGPFGGLKELGIYFGLVAILALVSLVGLRLAPKFRIVVTAILAFSVFLLMITNLRVVWWLLGVMGLASLLFSLYNNGFLGSKGSKVPTSTHGIIASMVILSIAGLFLFGGGGISGALAKKLNIGQIDIAPSFTTTLSIGKGTYGENALFGAGPNTFEKEWAKYRPIEANQTLVWNTNFRSGVGFLPTSFITTGLFGVIAWLMFLGIFLYTGARALLIRDEQDQLAYYFSLSSFVAAVYLWLIALFTVPGPVIIAYTFIFTGLFIASLRFHGSGLSAWNISFSRQPRLGFITVLALAIVVLVSITSLFTFGQHYAAALYYQKAVITGEVEGDTETAMEHTVRSLSLAKTDSAYRLAAEIDLLNIAQLVTSNSEAISEETGEQFRGLLTRAISSAERATQADPENYLNWMRLAQVYRSVVSLNVEGSYDNASNAYDRARVLRPDSPSILYEEAKLELLAGNVDAAKVLVSKALELRPNYSDAIFPLARIQVGEGETKEAIASVEAATILEQNNPVAFFQLGLLKYSDDDLEGAIAAFERAVVLNEDYSNARYFLGLSYDRLDRTEEAIEQFVRIQNLNQENKEVASILSNLRAGKAPFANNTPVVSQQETQGITELDELPIEEDDPPIESEDELLEGDNIETGVTVTESEEE